MKSFEKWGSAAQKKIDIVYPGPYFIKVKIFLKSGFKKNWSSLSLGEFFKFQFFLTLMLILFTIP